MFKKLVLLLLMLVIIAGLVLAFGPREPIDETITFDGSKMDLNLDAYLAEREKGIPNLTDGAEKQIVWNNPDAKVQTEYAFVYIHGFSATLEETRPLTDLVAKAFNGNIFYTRLKGHGRDGAGLAEATVNDWFNDTAEAIAIGKELGRKVIILSGSTGGTFSTWAATKPELMKDVTAMVMVSPNFGINHPAASLLTLGAARHWVPVLFGADRSFEPSSDEHAKWWTSKYPSVAVLPMMESVRFVNGLNFEDAVVPALFIFHKGDTVVRSDISEQVAKRWGKNNNQAADIFEVTESEDKNNHVIAGRVLSPSNSEPLANQTIKWIRGLK